MRRASNSSMAFTQLLAYTVFMEAPHPCRRLLSAIPFLIPLLVCGADLPEGCKPPSELLSAMREKPSAPVLDAAGAWFAEHGNLKCSVSAFEEAVRTEPGSAEAHYDLGVAYVRLKQLTAAAEQFRLALKNKPDMVVAHNSLGATLVDAGKPGEAEAEFREALRIDPKSIPALDRLAQILASQRRYDSALRYWNEALAIQPDSPDILLSLGTTTYQDASAKEAAGIVGAKNAGTKEAIRILSELTSRHPDMKEAHFISAISMPMKLGSAKLQTNTLR